MQKKATGLGQPLWGRLLITPPKGQKTGKKGGKGWVLGHWAVLEVATEEVA